MATEVMSTQITVKECIKLFVKVDIEEMIK